MDLLSSSNLIQKISQKILQPKQSLYSEQPILYAMSYLDNYEYVDSMVYNKYNEKLKVSLFFSRGVMGREYLNEKCIVYMHGYGSNCMEGLFLLRYLPRDMSMCCFDFSAEGRSEGHIVTYGHKEKDDIKAVLGYLRTCGYRKFVLWGRSMGATCTLLFSIKEKPIDVVLQILDSPFISFTEAALQLTKKRINIPEVLIKLALEALHKNLAAKDYNPFEINLDQPIHCPIPTIFLYSENDEVIPCSNSKRIISNFHGYYQKIVIQQLHNVLRKSTTIRDLMCHIKKFMIKTANLKNRQNGQQSTKSYKKQGSGDERKLGKKNSLDSYGIWVSSRMGSEGDMSCSDKMSTSRISSERRPKSSLKVYSSLRNLDEEKQTSVAKIPSPRIHRLASPKKGRLTQRLSFDAYL